MSEDPIRALIEKLEEDWRSSHPVTLEDLQEDLIGTLDTYLSRPSNEDLLQKLYDLCFVRIDKEAEPGLDAVHEASRDLVAVGYVLPMWRRWPQSSLQTCWRFCWPNGGGISERIRRGGNRRPCDA
jgi:hypothetical protein